MAAHLQPQYTPLSGDVVQSVDNASLICLQFIALRALVFPVDGDNLYKSC